MKLDSAGKTLYQVLLLCYYLTWLVRTFGRKFTIQICGRMFEIYRLTFQPGVACVGHKILTKYAAARLNMRWHVKISDRMFQTCS